MLYLHSHTDVVDWPFIVAGRHWYAVLPVDENSGAVVDARCGHHGEGEPLFGDVVAQLLGINRSASFAPQRRGVEQMGQFHAGKA